MMVADGNPLSVHTFCPARFHAFRKIDMRRTQTGTDK